MPDNEVDLYHSSYGNYELDVYRRVRLATYGEDLGQTSWVTNDESREIPLLLQLTPESSVLEIGCGSGRYALHVADAVGCRVLGMDVVAPAIDTANQLSRARNMGSRVSFQQGDVSRQLPFAEQAFEAVFANDVRRRVGRSQHAAHLRASGAFAAHQVAVRTSLG